MYPATQVEYSVGGTLNIPQTISANGSGWSEALDRVSDLHEQDGAAGDVYYYGLFQPTDSIGQYCGGGCVAGIGFVTGTQSFARHQRVSLGLSFANTGSAETFAHELGHNHGRTHPVAAQRIPTAASPTTPRTPAPRSAGGASKRPRSCATPRQIPTSWGTARISG